MKSDFPRTRKEIIRRLESEGWILNEQAGKGSHVKLSKEGHKPIILPIDEEYPKGTLNSI